MKTIQSTTIFALLALLFSCEDMGSGPGFPPDTRDQVTITQGIWGNVWFWEGDFMPSTDPGGSGGRITPVIREVFVHAATTYDSVGTSPIWGTFYSRILTTCIAQSRSNATGFFEVSLPPGKYSIFVKEDTLYYANGSDSEGHIMPSRVFADSVTKVQFDITYKAAY